MPEDHRTQYIALGIMLTGLIFIAMGCHFNWRDLIIAATGVVGTGQGIITGFKLASVLNQKGGVINAPQAPTETQS